MSERPQPPGLLLRVTKWGDERKKRGEAGGDESEPRKTKLIPGPDPLP